MPECDHRYLVTFGGGSVGHCNNDLWYLDTATNTWHEPPMTGPLPAARAGCCAALLGNRWYVFGGGNNSAGCPDMWMLDLLKLGLGSLTWEKGFDFDMRSSLASEGASVTAAPALGALVAFGGYNGTYHNAVSVFKPADAAHADWVEQGLACGHAPRCTSHHTPVLQLSAFSLSSCSCRSASILILWWAVLGRSRIESPA
jgi:N-acetylneuraminic acid mutarotase